MPDCGTYNTNYHNKHRDSGGLNGYGDPWDPYNTDRTIASIDEPDGGDSAQQSILERSDHQLHSNRETQPLA